MKRKIGAILTAIAMVFGVGLIAAPTANADVLCYIFFDEPVFTDGSHYYIRGAAASSCNTVQIQSQRMLTVLKEKQPSGEWTTVPNTSSGWRYNDGSYMRVPTGAAFCSGSDSRDIRVELSHGYNGGPIHYHNGITVNINCNP